MDFSDPVSDYIRKSILTAQGDIVVRGVSQPGKLAIGSAEQILQVNSGATGLEYVNKPGVGYNNLNRLASTLALGGSWTTIFSMSDISISANDLYLLYVAIRLYASATGYATFRLRADTNNDTYAIINGYDPGTGFEGRYDFYIYASNYRIHLLPFLIEVQSGSILDIYMDGKVTSGTGTLYTAGTCYWYNKLN